MNENKVVEEPTNQTVHDPVCHMDIAADQAPASAEYDGHTYYFCSLGCKDSFDANPAQTVEAENAYAHAVRI